MTTQKSHEIRAASNASTVDATPTVTPSVVYIKRPPPQSAALTPPAGFTNANPVDYRAMLPRNLEMATMPDVLAELSRFADYAAVFGKTAPALEFVEQTFTAATEWTQMRVKNEEWDIYSRTQEGAAWSDVRRIMKMLAPALALAAQTDATIAREFPALARLFDAKKVIAQRGLASRKANEKSVSEGKMPTRGRAGKRARKAAIATTGGIEGSTPKT
jgi:hypothetical protein